jgi:hypothetical protein
MEFSDKLKKTLETAQETDYLVIIFSLLFCIISSFILMYVYRNRSNSLSSKIQIAPIIPLLSTITFLVIVIVKSSLALSLGLVGALSVIRFRTPIKEPEDLAFLFLSIAIGIGYGALQIYATTIVFLVIIFIIWFFLSRENLNLSNNFNLIVEIDNKNQKDYFDKILENLKDNSEDVHITKIEKDLNSIYYYYKVSFKNIQNMKEVTDNLNKNFQEIKYTFYENKILD